MLPRVKSINNNQASSDYLALTDISHSAVCCHSNKTSAPIANATNSAQLEGTPKLHMGPCSSVGMRRGTDTQTAVTTIPFASSTTHTKCNDNHQSRMNVIRVPCSALREHVALHQRQFTSEQQLTGWEWNM